MIVVFVPLHIVIYYTT